MNAAVEIDEDEVNYVFEYVMELMLADGILQKDEVENLIAIADALGVETADVVLMLCDMIKEESDMTVEIIPRQEEAIDINESMTVKELKDQFIQKYNCQLQIYKGYLRANDTAILAEISEYADFKEGNMVVSKVWNVDEFENYMMNQFGVKTQVYTRDGWVQVLDGISLGITGTIKKGAVKVDMESLIGK